MKERPILFSAPMVRAILEGRKTQTRRVVKELPLLGVPSAWCAAAKAQDPGWVHIVGDYRRFCPYGAPGDRLWVRETWCDTFAEDDDSRGGYCYAATNKGPEPLRWRPSIYMPRRASRLTLEIEAVRVERLQEINADDAEKEGCGCGVNDETGGPVARFKTLWESINGPGSWNANHWVWVIQFKKIGEKGPK